MKKRMDWALVLLLASTGALFVVAFRRDAGLPLEALGAAGRALRAVGLELALGFVLVGLIEVLVSKDALAAWLSGSGQGRAIVLGSVAGLVLPGGPYVFFPFLAGLAHKGAPAGALIALASAKLLVSPARMLAYEAPLLGWRFTLARLLPAILVPPLLGLAGHWIFTLLGRRS